MWADQCGKLKNGFRHESVTHALMDLALHTVCCAVLIEQEGAIPTVFPQQGVPLWGRAQLLKDNPTP